MFIVMDYLAQDFRGLTVQEWVAVKAFQQCWVCADNSKNNVEQSGNLHDWHKCMSVRERQGSH